MRVFFVSLVSLAAAVGTLWLAEAGIGPLVVIQEDEFKIVRMFGDPVDVYKEPGLGFRWPLITVVTEFDNRLQYLDAEPVELQIANSERLVVDYYAIWRIVEPLEFMTAFPMGMGQAEGRIKRTINAAVQAQVARLDLSEILSRAEILTKLDEMTSAELSSDGVRVVDVRINKTEVTAKAEPAAYAQMREQRRAVAREHRAIGERRAREVRAEAEGEARTTIAGAKAEAQVLMGEGDAEAARIYADAYSKAPEFYAFLRSLEAYRKTLGDNTTMVMAPDHEFFRYLQPDAALAGE
jgi:membrane protease subunit HflC